MDAPFISSDTRAGRIVSGGKIASLATAFSLKDSKPFSIFLKKGTGTSDVEVFNVKLLGNAAVSEFPFKTEQWNEAFVTQVSSFPAASGYDIYWSSGDVAETV